MKCDNCGNEIKNMLVCPLCGYRQGKINRCSVCTTIIHYGQSNCPNCGNPTKYLKKDDIIQSIQRQLMFIKVRRCMIIKKVIMI